jgi:hypothetical protein
MTQHKKTISVRSKRAEKAAKALAKGLKAKSTVRVLEKFDIKTIPPSIRKSPLKLSEWLDRHIPWFASTQSIHRADSAERF